jgi:hypothetical protein
MSGSGGDHQGVVNPQRPKEHKNRVVTELDRGCVSPTLQASTCDGRKSSALENALTSYTLINEASLLIPGEFNEYTTTPIQKHTHSIGRLDQEGRNLNHDPLHPGY